ncbi:hypothetical protein GGR55DRAFT_673010 [Xylaria sp. FL0064]|nr:hypothetical protein GGR55DRAFT_673010 [Xylaria sp. FL0064]
MDLESAKPRASFLAVRDLKKNQSFLEPGCGELIQFGFSKLASVKACAKIFLKKSFGPNTLVCNALMNIPMREEKPQGFKMQLPNSFFGHFLLFWLLEYATVQAAKATSSSSRHRASEILFDNFQLKHGYDPAKA